MRGPKSLPSGDFGSFLLFFRDPSRNKLRWSYFQTNFLNFQSMGCLSRVKENLKVCHMLKYLKFKPDLRGWGLVENIQLKMYVLRGWGLVKLYTTTEGFFVYTLSVRRPTKILLGDHRFFSSYTNLNKANVPDYVCRRVCRHIWRNVFKTNLSLTSS